MMCLSQASLLFLHVCIFIGGETIQGSSMYEFYSMGRILAILF